MSRILFVSVDVRESFLMPRLFRGLRGFEERMRGGEGLDQESRVHCYREGGEYSSNDIKVGIVLVGTSL